MKRTLLCIVSLAALTSVWLLAQDKPQDSSTQTANSASAPQKNIQGTISDDGKTFTTDEDKASWTIINPDAVTGHAGHHVDLSAHVYPDKHQIHVMSVSMMSGQNAPAESASNAASDNPELRSLSGTISDDGKAFKSSEDNKSWAIVNPDAVKGHEGHKVTVSAHVYPDKNSIHVMSLEMAK